MSEPEKTSRIGAGPAALLGGVIALGLAAGAGYGERERLRSWLLQDETKRLTAIEAQLGELSTHPTAPEDFELRLGKLQSALEDLRRGQPSETMILRLSERIEAMEQALRTQGAQQLQLVAVGQLREAVARGEGFDPELQAARSLLQGDDLASLDPLTEFAASGIWRRDQLRQALPALAQRMLELEAAARGPGWWPQIKSNLLRVVMIRRMDGKGNDAEAVMARTEAALARDDWEGAAREVSGLSGRFAEDAATWRRQLDARNSADKILSRLTAQAAAHAAAH